VLRRFAEAAAFELLREHSRVDSRKLLDLATAIVDGHGMLPRDPQDQSDP
jgi:response regulator NasT